MAHADFGAVYERGTEPYCQEPLVQLCVTVRTPCLWFHPERHSTDPERRSLRHRRNDMANPTKRTRRDTTTATSPKKQEARKQDGDKPLPADGDDRRAEQGSYSDKASSGRKMS